MEAFTGTGEDWVVVFDSINVALFQLVEVLKYTASSEDRNIHVTAWVNVVSQVHFFVCFILYHFIRLIKVC